MGLEFLNHNYVRVTLYLVASGACFAASLAEARRGRGRWPWVWALVALVVLVFGVGRELQIGDWVTQRGRDLAHSQGWYNERRPLQRLADVAVALAGLAAAAVLVTFSWRNWRSHTSAVFVLVLMAVFVAVRAISYHYTDRVLYGERWHGAEVNSAIEVGLTLILTATALVTLAWPSRRASSPR